MRQIQSLRAEQSRAEQSRAEQSRAQECRIGNIYGASGGSHAGQVYDSDHLAPTLTDMQGGGRQPHVVETQRIICAMRGRNVDNPSDRTAGIELEQRLEPNEQGICNTLTSVQKDNLVLESECLGGFGDKKSNGGTQYFQHYRVYSMGEVALCLPSQIPGGSYNYLEKKQIIYDDYNSVIPEDQDAVPTLTTNCGASATRNGVKIIEAEILQNVDPKCHDFIYKIDGEYWLIRIRKLTPLECWKLMNFTEEDFHKAEKVVSNTQLYRQCGNSIVTSVLEAIFRRLIE